MGLLNLPRALVCAGFRPLYSRRIVAANVGGDTRDESEMQSFGERWTEKSDGGEKQHATRTVTLKWQSRGRARSRSDSDLLIHGRTVRRIYPLLILPSLPYSLRILYPLTASGPLSLPSSSTRKTLISRRRTSTQWLPVRLIRRCPTGSVKNFACRHPIRKQQRHRCFLKADKQLLFVRHPGQHKLLLRVRERTWRSRSDRAHEHWWHPDYRTTNCRCARPHRFLSLRHRV